MRSAARCYRLFVSRRHLLDWVTAAQAQLEPAARPRRLLPADERRRRARRSSLPPSSWRARDGAGALAAPFVIAWIASPVDRALDQPLAARRRPRCRSRPRTRARCASSRAGPGASSRPSSRRRTTCCRRTTSRRTRSRSSRIARRRPTSASTCSSTVERPRLRLGRHDRHGRAAGSDARDDERPAALPRPLLQLVRHARPAAARPAVRLVGGQRQPRRASDRARECLPRVERPPGGAAATCSAGIDDALAPRARGRCAALPDDRRTQTITRQQLDDALDALADALREAPMPPADDRVRGWRRSRRTPRRWPTSRARSRANAATTPAPRCCSGRRRRCASIESHRRDVARGRRRRPRPGTAPGDAGGDGARHGRRDGVRLPPRPGAQAALDRLPRRGRHARPELLRPARLRGAAGELRRDRQGRRPVAALVPARARRDRRSDAARRSSPGRARCSST